MRYPFVSTLVFSLWLWMSGLSISQTQAQNSLPTEKMKLLEASLRSGDQKWKAKEYYEAGQFYAKAVEIAPQQTNAQYRLAECYRLTFDNKAAEATYAQVFQADGKTYPLAQYYHALMLKANGKYAEAILHLDEFTTAWNNPGDRPEAISDEVLARAKQLKDRCQMAMNEPQPDLSYFDRNKLSDLSPEYRLKADRIIQRKEAGRMHKEEMPLFGEEAYFFNLQLSQGERAKVTKITANGLEKLSNAQMEVIQVGDQQHYQTLSAAEKARIDRFAVAYRRATDVNERVIVSEEDDIFYGLLNREQKNQLDRVVAYRMHVAIGSQMARDKNKQNRLAEKVETAPTAITASLEPKPLTEAEQNAEDLRYYNSLPEKDKVLLDRFIEAKRLSKRTGNDLVLEGEDKFAYEKLSEQDKARIDRLMKILPEKATLSLAEQQTEDLHYYNSLPEKDKAQLDAIIAAKRLSKRTGDELVLEGKDKFAYEKLSELEKARVDRLMTFLPEHNAALTEAEQKAEDLRYYNALPEKDKVLLDKLIEAKRLSKRTGNALVLEGEDRFAYEKLSELDKARIDRLMKILPEKATLTLAEQRAEDLRYYNSLPEKNKAQLNRLFAARLLARRTDKALVLNQEDQLYYEKLSEVEKARIGRLTTWFEENENNRTALLGDKPVEKAQTSEIATGFSNPEPIFFNFDEETLRPEAEKALDELAGFCQKFPEARLEIHAFADDKGEATYNKELSKRRGQAAVDYLTRLGVSAKHVKVKAHGEGDLLTLGDSLFARQVNRRVEFVVKNGPETYAWESQTYILQPQATLYSIARAFGLTVEELKTMNGLPSEHIEAYRPIRARHVTGAIPTWMVNDPYFWIRKKAERSLTVK
jgi:outer membrane protein OmpA-like peptidoglycan-associated protein